MGRRNFARISLPSSRGDTAHGNVLVTTGTSEANFSTLWGLLDKTGRAAVMIPNYLQAWGLARAYAARADAYPGSLSGLEETGVRRWALDIESLRKAVTKQTKLILVTNPNNPTGAVLTEAEMDEIIRLARKVGAWIIADEVYRGAEVEGDQITPTFWGRYPKVIVTAGLSKSFGMPGVRVGWIVGPEKTVAHLWSYQDYTTLTPSVLSDRLARIATEPARRKQILARTRSILHTNLPQLERWIHTHDDIFSYIRPVAGAIVLVKYAFADSVGTALRPVAASSTPCSSPQGPTSGSGSTSASATATTSTRRWLVSPGSMNSSIA